MLIFVQLNTCVIFEIYYIVLHFFTQFYMSGVWAKRRTSHSTLAKINYLFQEYEIYYIFLKLDGPAVNYPYKEIFWGLDFFDQSARFNSYVRQLFWVETLGLASCLPPLPLASNQQHQESSFNRKI